MASESTEPKAPQAEVVAVSTTNNPARVGPYTDTALTKRNVDSGPAPDLDVPPPSGSKTLGNVRPVYAGDQQNEIDVEVPPASPPIQPPPHSPNSWRTREVAGNKYPRDPYAQQGLDDYLNNG